MPAASTRPFPAAAVRHAPGFCRNFRLRRFGVCSLPRTYGAKGGRATMAVSFKGAHFPKEIILMGVRGTGSVEWGYFPLLQQELRRFECRKVHTPNTLKELMG